MPPLSNASKVTLSPCQVRLWRKDQWKESLHAWRGQRILASGKKACTHGKDSVFPPDACCCSHGGRCSCASKKEIAQPVLESYTDENFISTASADKSFPSHDLTLSSIDPLTPFANDHQMPLYPETEAAVAGGLSFVVPGIGSNYASQSSRTNPSTDDHSSLSTIDTRLSFPPLQDPLANSHYEPNLASSMEHRSHQSHPLSMSSSGLEPIEEQVPSYNGWEFEHPSDSFDYPLDFDNLASMTESDQPTSSAGLSSISTDWSHYDV
ncbi:hypothetical protein V493_00722 [Pseudogymnoascus sp. VKM F-4281 (FW-2241)]|nr:hypothetical protein V493_00722 [Pseudogymnoascus sp. VKM F-4281 (FW-2241)]